MASEIAQIVIDVAIPGGGTVLKVLELVGTLVQEVKDGKTTCIAVHERLTLILTELEDIQQRNGKLPGNAVDKYVQTLEEYWRHLQTYKEMNIVERVLNHRKLRATIESVNVSVDQLFQMVGLATTGVLMDWRKQYEKDMIEQQQAMEQVTRNAAKMLAELQGIHEQTDAIVLLKDALDKMRLGESDLAPESQAAVKNAFGTIIRTSNIAVPDVPKWFIQEADITFNERPFGRGAFGAVHRGKLKDHTKVVIKMLLPGETGLDAQLQKAFLHEVNLWDTFNHPHVVRMLGACHVSKRPFIVCEDATNGNMVDYLDRSPDHRKHLWRLLYEAAQGIAHLHSKNIVHGDLKLNNILVSADGKALIADFGLSRIKNKSKSKSMTARKDGQMVEGGVRWRAPELEKFLSQPQSDVFSFAMCILEAFLGEPPYAYLDDEAVKAKYAAGELPPKPEAMSDDAWELVRQMALPEPMDRISLAEVILKLQKFSEFELQQLSDTALLCDSCFMPRRDGDRFCSSCGIAIVPGAVAASVVAVNDVPTIAKLLQDIGDATSSVENKTSAARLLYRQLRADTDKRGEVQSDTEIPLLFNLARDTTSTMAALYAFGSLCVLEASSIAVSSKELSEVQSFLLDNVQLDAINLHELSSLDTHTFVEIVGLLAGLGVPHRNDLRGEVQHIAHVFKGSTGEIRQAALAALAALTTGHEDNLRELRMVSVAAELVEAIKHGNGDDRDNAALLVRDLVTDLSTAEEFVKPAIIHVLVIELQDGTQKRKQLIASALGNIAAAPDAPRLIGVRGGVAALLTLLEASENENLQRAVLSALRQILRDPSIGSMFVFCGGLTALEQSLTSSSADVVVDSLWALKTLVDADGNLRSVISQSSEILRVCFDRLKRGSSSEKSGAALVLRELVRGNPQVVRAVDEGDALHTLLDLVAANDPYARGAIINSFKTLLHAMPGKTSTQPEEEPSLKKTRFAPASSDVTAA